MEQNKMINETSTINGGNSNGGVVGKLVLGALGVAAGIGTVLFIKKRKANKEVEYVDSENVDDNE